MWGEILETHEGWSLNRGTIEDIEESRQVSEWLRTKEGKKTTKEVGEFVSKMFWDNILHHRS